MSSVSPTAVDTGPNSEETAAAKDQPRKQATDPDTRPSCFFRYFGIIVRIWGYITVSVLGVCCWWLITERVDYPYTSWYTVAATIVIGFLELVTIFDTCAICRDEGGLCCTCWRLIVWIDYWRKTIVYVLIAIPEFVLEQPAPVPFIAGSLMVFLGILYLLKTCESCHCCEDTVPRSKMNAKDQSAETPETKDVNAKKADDSTSLIEASEKTEQRQ